MSGNSEQSLSAHAAAPPAIFREPLPTRSFGDIQSQCPGQRPVRLLARLPHSLGISAIKLSEGLRHSRMDESVYRPGSVVRDRERTAIHLGLALPPVSCGLPAGSGGLPSNACAKPGRPGLLLGLAPGGVYRAAQVTLGAGGLLHHRFTLTPATPRRSVFCGTIPRVAPGGRYPPPCPVEPGPSSAMSRQPRITATVRPARPLNYSSVDRYVTDKTFKSLSGNRLSLMRPQAPTGSGGGTGVVPRKTSAWPRPWLD